MKRVVKYIVGIVLLVISILIGYMINNDKNYYQEMIKNINLKEIKYINKYDNKYIVIDKDSLYLFDDKYEEILRIDSDKLCDNSDNYELIYRNEEFQYLNDYYQDKKLIYEYFNAYNCEFIEKIVLGGL